MMPSTSHLALLSPNRKKPHHNLMCYIRLWWLEKLLCSLGHSSCYLSTQATSRGWGSSHNHYYIWYWLFLQLLYARSEMIDLLITSDVARYCEFRTITQILTLKDEKSLQVSLYYYWIIFYWFVTSFCKWKPSYIPHVFGRKQYPHHPMITKKKTIKSMRLQPLVGPKHLVRNHDSQ